METLENNCKQYELFKGVPTPLTICGLPLNTWFIKEFVEEIPNLEPQDGDVVIATYPKTGTIWMQYIVHQIITKASPIPPFRDMQSKVIPFLELTGVAALETLTTRPRVYRHHFPYNLVKKNTRAKVIYVYRRPEDTLISYFHFIRNMDSSLEFDQFFDNFLAGNIPYGSYFQHVLSYRRHAEERNILLVSYESLQRDRKAEILRIAKFLGDDFYNDLVNEEPIVDKILKHTSFAYMKDNLFLNKPEYQNMTFEKDEVHGEHAEKILNFFRQGVIGDGKKFLTNAQMLSLKEIAKDIMKGTDVCSEWFNE